MRKHSNQGEAETGGRFMANPCAHPGCLAAWIWPCLQDAAMAFAFPRRIGRKSTKQHPNLLPSRAPGSCPSLLLGILPGVSGHSLPGTWILSPSEDQKKVIYSFSARKIKLLPCRAIYIISIS